MNHIGHPTALKLSDSTQIGTPDCPFHFVLIAAINTHLDLYWSNVTLKQSVALTRRWARVSGGTIAQFQLTLTSSRSTQHDKVLGTILAIPSNTIIFNPSKSHPDDGYIENININILIY